MKQLQLVLHDRRRRQRGSILSAVLIIVAFMSILIGGMLTELTGSFMLSRALVTRVKAEATVTSAAELAIHQLQSGPVPAVCAQDYSGGARQNRGPWFLTLNGSPASVTQTCDAILPEQATGLASGAFTIDGVHATTAGQNRYLVSDSSGGLHAYPFGSTVASWSVAIGGQPTATLLPKTNSDGSSELLIPVAMAGSGCASHCVALFNDGGGAPSFRCSMPSSASVTATPAAEVSVRGSRNFPDYAFFANSSGNLYVYDASRSGGCTLMTTSNVGGRVAGAPLVFPGTVNGNHNNNSSSSDEIFVFVTNGSSTELQHWRYTETIGDCEGDQCDGENGQGRGTTTRVLSRVDSRSLVGGNAVGYAASSTAPPLTMAVATAGGRLELARISVSGGPSYNMSVGASAILPNGDAASRAPYWCHCPGGQDRIGVGGTKGFLYLFDTGLNLVTSYDGQADGRPSINTTPMADSSGEWYFGASDGYVYDVEIPVSGPQMFKAAKFGPGGSIDSSPIVGTCPAGPCLYFGSSSAGSYFVRIGATRVSDLRACISSAADSISCAANPRLWARVQVGPGAIWGGSGVYVQGWSFYSP